MAQHAFIDESKVGGLTLYAAILPAESVTSARLAMNAARPKGASRLHFCKESDRVRKAALPVICELPMTVYEFDFREVPERVARGEALRAVVDELPGLDVTRVVLEQDDSVVAFDRRMLSEALKRVADPFEFQHMRATQEPLLWIPDAVAWCHRHKRQEWRARVRPFVVRARRDAA